MSLKSRHWLWLVLLVPVALGLARLRFDVDVLDLLPPDVGAVQGLKLYQEHFANADELMIAIQAGDADEARNAARILAAALAAQTNLVRQVVWQAPWLEHPGGTADFLAYLWFNQPAQIFDALTNRLDPAGAAARLAAVREQLATSLSPNKIARLGYDPFGLTQLPASAAGVAPDFRPDRELFASADGTFRILTVEASSDLATYRDCIQWLQRVKAVVREARRNGLPSAISVHYTGSPVFVAETSSGMQGDLTKSVGFTIAIIVLLFWWAHRRWRPLLWLITLLAAVLTGALGLAGLIFGDINVVSVGFAAILLGLAVDYGLVLYQESLHEPTATAKQLRRAIGPGILWSALTTAGAFAILNLGGLPGLAQLGSLVAIGVSLAAVVMLNAYLPPLMRGRVHLKGHGATPASSARSRLNISNPPVIWAATTGLALTILVVCARYGLPRIDHSSAALRPAHSEAYTTMAQIQQRLARSQEAGWLIIGGTNVTTVAQRLAEVQSTLELARSNHLVGSFTLPTALWPRRDFQAANRGVAQQLAARSRSLLHAARAAGFTSNSLALTEGMLSTWRRAATATNVFWPSDTVSDWVLGKVAARAPGHFYALGLLYPATNRVDGASALAQLESELPREHVWLAGWERLGVVLLGVVEHDFWHVMLPMVVLLLFSLWLAFRRVSEVLLSLATLLFSLLCLLTLMKLAGWSWNLLNLMALPLLFGAGVDYSIHMQLALRRHHGNILTAHRTVGRALLLCAGTTVTGFGSNVWSNNAGLVSLGQVCAAGIACAYLTANFLLPVWWRTFAGRGERVEGRGSGGEGRVTTPSTLYRAEFWKLGQVLARILPRGICAAPACVLAGMYWRLAPRRRAVVEQNLLPALNNDRKAARKKTRILFRQFALKLVDLWRYEAGLPIHDLYGPGVGWEHFARAQAEERGILLLTPHLGNWEFGGPWLTRHGIRLQVVTLAEPGEGFTELRRASRARWNIETLVIGNDPFGFLELIRRLEAGATVALLIDRPPPATAVTVNLFGRPFAASIAAAELARASGCVLLPVYLPRAGSTYQAHVLPAIPYDRAALRDRQARQELTQKIVAAFEPIIGRHPDQWFHFVPVWPKE